MAKTSQAGGLKARKQKHSKMPASKRGTRRGIKTGPRKVSTGQP